MLTYVTGLFLVFAGMIIGYFLSRNEHNGDDENRQRLHKENSELRASLNRGKVSLTELEEKYSRQNGQLNILQQLCDDWSASREESERDRTKLELQLTDYQSRSEDLTTQLQGESQNRIKAEDELHRFQQQQAERFSGIEADWMQRYSSIETSLTQHMAELKLSQNEKTRTAEQLHEAQARIAELMSELGSQKTMYQTACSNATGLKQEYTTLETSVQDLRDSLKESESNCAKAISAKRLAEESLKSVTGQLEKRQTEIVELQSSLASMQALKQQYGSLEASLSSSDDRLQIVASERDRAIGAEKAAHEHMAGLQKQVENQESTIQALRSKHDEVLDKLRLEMERRAELDRKYDMEKMGMRQEIESQSSTLQEIECERDELIARLSSERDKLSHQLQEESKNRSQIERTMAQVQESLTKTKQNQTRLTAEVEEESRMRIEFENLCEQVRQEKNKAATECERLRVSLENETRQREQFENEYRETNQRLIAAVAECERLKTTTEHESDQRSHFALSWEQSRTELEQFKAQCQKLEVGLSAEVEQKTYFETAWKQNCEEIVELQTECERLRGCISGDSQQLEGLNSDVLELRSKLSNETKLRTELELRKDELENALVTLKARCDAMMAELSELQTIRDQHAVASEKWKEYRIRLEQTISQRDSSLGELSTYRVEIESLRLQLASANATIVELRDRLTALETQRGTDSMILPLGQVRQTVDREYGGETRIHRTRGRVFTSRPNMVDDLKLISGVATVLEGKLNDYGVYTFRQVMEWDQTNIAEFQELLPAFKDRIERDDWVGQAAHLYDHFHQRSEARAA